MMSEKYMKLGKNEVKINYTSLRKLPQIRIRRSAHKAMWKQTVIKVMTLRIRSKNDPKIC